MGAKMTKAATVKKPMPKFGKPMPMPAPKAAKPMAPPFMAGAMKVTKK